MAGSRGSARHALAAVLLLAVPAAARAQQPAPPRPNPPVLVTILGGDSAQATLVQLRRRTVYRLQFQPATAQLSVRFRTRDGSTVPPLDTLPSVPADSLAGYGSTRVATEYSGEYIVELTNAQIGATSVRMTAMGPARRAPRLLVAQGEESPGPQGRSFMSFVVAAAIPVLLLGSLF